MRKLHLDSEYRNRWIEFFLVNGTVEDSRLKNWREVSWGDVIQIAVHILDHVHVVNCKGAGFKAFMNFRWGGQEAEYDRSGKYTGHKAIKIWTVGWTDGGRCFLKDVDFYTGNLIKEYVTPLKKFEGHLHPAVKDKVLR